MIKKIVLILAILFISGSVFASSTATITHKTMAVPNAEYIVTLEAFTNSWTIGGQAGAPIKFGNVAGCTAGSSAYKTIPAGGNWQEDNKILYANQTWFFSSTATDELEILIWK